MYPWVGNLNIPEGERGTFRVQHHMVPANRNIPLVSDWQRRMKIIEEKPPLVFDKPTRWHVLKDKEGDVWMTDYPQEQYQSDVLLAPIQKGRVLVGGLGLGYVPSVLAKRPGIKHIDVIEIERDVIDLVAFHLPDPDCKITVVHADLFEFLERKNLNYDWAFYDIWRSAEENVFFDYIIPLIDLTLPLLPEHRIICWNEEMFRCQMEMALTIGLKVIENSTPEEKKEEFRRRTTETGDVYHDWAVPFFQQAKDQELTEENAIQYAATYGRTIYTQLEDE